MCADHLRADWCARTCGSFFGAKHRERRAGRKYPKKKPWRDRAYAALDDTRMARDSRYKFVLRANGPNELYDLDNDPTEQINRADDPEFIGVRADLTRELNNWK